MKYDLERIWKEVVLTESRYCSGICFEGLRKDTINLGIAGVPAEIRTEHLSNTRVQRLR
jgi:hypothetical protein